MWIYDLVIDEDRENHIARHDVEASEAREVIFGDHYAQRERHGYYRCTGQTDAGRYLSVFVAPIEPGIFALVTARDATDAERRQYRAHRRS
jgi:uncharacterized DUF497 family protein